MGSVIEGEDVVQDTFALARAFVALDELEETAPLRVWLFRIAHNRALALLRSRAIRAAEPIEAAHEVAKADIVTKYLDDLAAKHRFKIRLERVQVQRRMGTGETHGQEQGGRHAAPQRTSRNEHTSDCVAEGVGGRAPAAPREGEVLDTRA